MRSFVREPSVDGDVNWRVVLKLFPYLLRYRARVVISVLLMVAAKVSGVVMPITLKHIVDSLDPSLLDSPEKAVLAVPVFLLLSYGLLRFFNVFFSELRDAVFSRVTEKVQRVLGLEVFQHLHHLDLEFHLSRRTGGLARDIERGTRGMGFILRFALFNIVPTLIEVLLVAAILYGQYDYRFALIALFSVVIYVAFSVVATEWRTGYVREANLMDNQANSRAIDSLLNFETVKYFGNEDYESNRYDQDLGSWEEARLKNRLSLAALNSGQAFIIAAGITAMMFLATAQVVKGDMTLGDLVLVNAFMIQVFMPLNVLGFVYREIKASLADIERLFLLLETRSRVTDHPNAKVLQIQKADIEFKDVCFSYHPERPILKGLSFKIQAGEKVAIVGRSGAGKSTISRLLFRFYDVDSGAIIISGQDIREVSQSSLRRHIGIVPQDTVLFNDTLINNIHYGKPEADLEAVYRATNMAHLDGFVQQLPKGVDTLVGERGLKISGGEKQRVAIARVLLKAPDILLFDEATSSLDSEAEQAILKAINEVSQQHTSIVIAHRLSTIVDADKIIVLDQGQIVEMGRHEELLDRDGVYKKLWDMQKRSSSTMDALNNG